VIAAALSPMTAYAKGVSVTDLADLLTSAEESDLSARLDALSEKYGMDVSAVTTESLGGKSIKAYSDDYYDDNGYGVGGERSGVMLLIDMGTRFWAVTTRGLGIEWFTNYGIDLMMSGVGPRLSEGEYAAALGEYAAGAEMILENAAGGHIVDVDSGGGADLTVIVLVSSGVGLVAALVSVTAMKARLRSVRPERLAMDYARAGSFRLTGGREVFLFRNVSVMPIEREHGGHSGGSSTRVSSSGSRHGGRTGRF
jgi:uncharacterized protein